MSRRDDGVPAMIDTGAAAGLLRAQLPALADEWQQRCAAAVEQTSLTPSRARAVLAVVVYSFDEQPYAVNLDAALASLFEHDPDLSVSVGELAILRLVLHRTLVLRLPSEDAFAATERLHALVDAVIARMAQRQLAALEDAAFVDPLTGVGNRRALEREGARVVAQGERHGWALSVVAIDLDGLKLVNDSVGHPAGDQLLRRLADALAAQVRAADSVYRVGGDEFVLLLPETGPEQAGALLERVASSAPPFSFGTGVLGRDGSTLEEVLSAADRRLLERKRARLRAAASGESSPCPLEPGS